MTTKNCGELWRATFVTCSFIFGFACLAHNVVALNAPNTLKPSTCADLGILYAYVQVASCTHDEVMSVPHRRIVWSSHGHAPCECGVRQVAKIGWMHARVMMYMCDMRAASCFICPVVLLVCWLSHLLLFVHCFFCRVHVIAFS